MAYQPKSYRKFIATGVATAMVATAVAPAVSANFPDVDQDLWHAEYINFAFERGFIEGDPSGDFRPFDNMTRAEAVTVVLRMLGEDPNELEDVTTTTFPDTTGDQWWSPAIERAVELGVVQGKADGNFHPGANLTRAEFAEMLFNAFDIEADEDNMVEFDDLVEDAWYEEAIMALASNGIIEGDGDGTFRPNDDVQRNESAAMVQRTVLLIEGEDEDPIEVEGLTVESVSAINAQRFDMTVNFDEEVDAEELEGTTLTLDGPAGELTAAFEEMDNGVAVYEITNTSDLTPGDGSADGTYEVTSDSFNVAEGVVTTYSEILTANVIEGFVFSEELLDTEDDDGRNGRVEGASVSVGNRTVTTDARGMYTIPANPGERSIEISAPGHYTDRDTVTVDRNYASAHNVTLEAYDRELLLISGTVANEETLNGVDDVTVKLQVADGDDWETISEAETGSNGQYIFHNSEAEVPSNFSVSGNAIQAFASNDSDRLNLGVEYRVVYEKTVQDFLFDNYESYESDSFELSETEANTSQGLIELRQIEELPEINFEVDWAQNTTTANDISVQLLNTNGSSALTDADSFEAERDSENNLNMAESVDLIDVLDGEFTDNDTKLRLPDGTYFLRVVNHDNNNIENAITIVELEVSEGEAVTTEVKTIQRNATASLDARLRSISYDAIADFLSNGTTLDTLLVDDGTVSVADNGEADIETNLEVKETVGDVDVVVYPRGGLTGFNNGTIAPQNFVVEKDNGNIERIEADTTTINFLAANASYSGSITNDYLRGSDFEIEASTTFAESTAQFSSAASLTKVNLDADDDKLVHSVELLNSSDAVVDTFSPDEMTVETFNEYFTGDNVDDGSLRKVFSQITPGQYKLRVNVDGYETKTTSLKTYHDFQQVQITDAIELEEIPENTLFGTLRFSDNNDLVSTGDTMTAALYNDDNQLVAANDVDGTQYSLVNGEDGVVEEGTYTLIIRGEGMETLVREVEVEGGEQRLNLRVERGGNARAQFQVRDSNGFAIDNDGIEIRDAYYTSQRTDANSIVSRDTVQFLGDYDFSGANTDSENGRYFTGAKLSAGDYSLVIPETTTYFGSTVDFRIQSPGDTFYRVVTAPAKSTEPLVPVTVEFDHTSDTYATVVDEDGNIVDTKKDLAPTGEVTLNVPQNGTYTVNVYSQGRFVGSNNVTVQDFPITVNVGLRSQN